MIRPLTAPSWDRGCRRPQGTLGYDPEESFHVDEEALAHARKVAERGPRSPQGMGREVHAWRKANPDNAALYDRLKAGELPEGFDKAIDDLEATFEVGKGVATRGASGSVLNAIAAVMPELWGAPPTSVAPTRPILRALPPSLLPSAPPSSGRSAARTAVSCTSACASSPWVPSPTASCWAPIPTRPFGGTFFMFSDYERSAVRLAAPHADSEPVCVVPRLRRRRRRWSDSPAGGAPGFLPCHPAA